MESRQATSSPNKVVLCLLNISTLVMFMPVLLYLNPAPPDKALLLRLGTIMISGTIIAGLLLGFLLYRPLTRRHAIPLIPYLRIWLAAGLMVGGMMAFIFWLVAQGVSPISTYLIAITIFWGVSFLFVKWCRLQRSKFQPGGRPAPAGSPEAQ